MRPAPLAAAGLAVVTVLLSAGCSQPTSAVDGNNPNGNPSQQPVVRTPSPVGTGLPYTDPPLINTLPGPTGGVPGEVPTTAPPASPTPTDSMSIGPTGSPSG